MPSFANCTFPFGLVVTRSILIRLLEDCFVKTSVCVILFKVWDTTSTGAGEQSLHGGDTKAMEIAALEFSHDGSKLAAVIDNCDYVQVLETESGKLLTSIKVCYKSNRTENNEQKDKGNPPLTQFLQTYNFQIVNFLKSFCAFDKLDPDTVEPSLFEQQKTRATCLHN